MKQLLLKKTDEMIMNFWNEPEMSNEEKFNCVKRLEEIQMILQGETL